MDEEYVVVEEEEEQEEKDESAEKEEEKESSTCQTLVVGLWVKKKSNKYIDEFLDFMESLGFTYIDYKIPEDKELKKKVIILFFSYNSCRVVELEGIERPLSMDGAMLNFISKYYPNFIYDFHNVNPNCDYHKMRKKKVVLDEEGNDEGNVA